MAQPLIAFCSSHAVCARSNSIGRHIGTTSIHSLAGQVDAQKQVIAHLQVRNEQQSRLIRAYEQGKFMRFMRWLSSVRPGV